MRNTPWVEGCCGPIDTSINSPSKRDVIPSGAEGSRGVSLRVSSRDPSTALRPAPDDTVIFAPLYSPRRLIAAAGRNVVLLSPAHRRAESARIRNRLVHDNPSALGNLRTHPTSGCAAYRDDRRSECRTDRRFLALEILRCAKWASARAKARR